MVLYINVYFSQTCNLDILTIYPHYGWAGHVARMEEGRSAFKILSGKPTGKRPLGSPRHIWKDDIRFSTVFTRAL